MVSEYRNDFINGDDARGYDTHSDSDTGENEPIAYEDWSTIYNEELWYMWYSMKEYLDAKYMYSELFGNIDPDDFFYDFCFLDPPDIIDDYNFEECTDDYLNDIKYLWRLIRGYRHVYGNKNELDFIHFVLQKK